jgi:hypothetical protein
VTEKALFGALFFGRFPAPNAIDAVPEKANLYMRVKVVFRRRIARESA